MAEPAASSAPFRTVRLRIEGRVQGVGFRAWFEAAARGLALRGWVRNRRDGGVEALLCGPVAQVDDMIRRAHIGPPHAVVAMVKVLDEPGLPEIEAVCLFAVRDTV